MSISREVALDRLRRSRDLINEWIDELDRPSTIQNGEVVETYPGGVPRYINVSDIECVDIEQARGEIALIAAELDALAASV